MISTPRLLDVINYFELNLNDGSGQAESIIAALRELAETRREGSMPMDGGGRQHSDDVAVDQFAASMKNKLSKKRTEGRGGWDDPQECTVTYLAELLVDHCKKVNSAVDIANFAMMIWHRTKGEDSQVIPEAMLAAAPRPQEGA